MIIPVGLLLFLTTFDFFETWIRGYGEWAFKQLEDHE